MLEHIDKPPPEEPPPPEAFGKLREMLALLNADLEEAEIARRVRDFDGGDMELQMFTWKLMTYKEQCAWREFRQMAYREGQQL